MSVQKLVVIDFPDAELANDFMHFMEESGEQDYEIWRGSQSDDRMVTLKYQHGDIKIITVEEQ